MKLYYCLLMVLLAVSIVPARAMTLPPVPTEPIYFEPPVVSPTSESEAYSCAQLDMAINKLHPYRYTYKPGFYQDGANQLATAAITLDWIPVVNGLLGAGYLGYSVLVEEKESRRMLSVEQQISALQGLKAQKHCYE